MSLYVYRHTDTDTHNVASLNSYMNTHYLHIGMVITVNSVLFNIYYPE